MAISRKKWWEKIAWNRLGLPWDSASNHRRKPSGGTNIDQSLHLDDLGVCRMSNFENSYYFLPIIGLSWGKKLLSWVQKKKGLPTANSFQRDLKCWIWGIPGFNQILIQCSGCSFSTHGPVLILQSLSFGNQTRQRTATLCDDFPIAHIAHWVLGICQPAISSPAWLPEGIMNHHHSSR